VINNTWHRIRYSGCVCAPLSLPALQRMLPRSTWMNSKIHAYSLTGFPPPANGLLHITQAATHRRDTLRRSSPHPSTISYSKHARQRPKLWRRRLPMLHLLRGEQAGAGRERELDELRSGWSGHEQVRDRDGLYRDRGLGILPGRLGFKPARVLRFWRFGF